MSPKTSRSRTARGAAAGVLNEFAATVDLSVRGNRFSADAAAGLGLDLGTAYFDVASNQIDMSRNIGSYLLYGVHDGTFNDNAIGFVSSSGSAFGLLAWGTQNVSIADNTLAGGEGPAQHGDIGSQLPRPGPDPLGQCDARWQYLR